MRTVTVTETITRFAIDPPQATHFPWSPEDADAAPALEHALNQVGAPAFLSTFRFLLTAIAVFLATAAVTYLLLQTKSRLLRVYSGSETTTTPEQDKAMALVAARSITLSHVLTVMVLVLRTRTALQSLEPLAYEVCTLVLGMEAAVSAVAGCVWAVVRVVEQGTGGFVSGGGGEKKNA